MAPVLCVHRVATRMCDLSATGYAPALPFPTGGIASEFYRLIEATQEQSRFEMLTARIAERAREQYVVCWRRWAQVRACLGVSPWISDVSPGFGNRIAEFLVWGRNLDGHQYASLE